MFPGKANFPPNKDGEGQGINRIIEKWTQIATHVIRKKGVERSFLTNSLSPL